MLKHEQLLCAAVNVAHCECLGEQYLAVQCLQPVKALPEAVVLDSRCAGPPLDDLLGSKEKAVDCARGMPSCYVEADIVYDQRRVQEQL